MIRWTALIGWLACGFIALGKMGAPTTLERSRLVSRRVEHHIRVLGVEWTTMVRENPAHTGPCAGDEPGTPVVRARAAAR